MNQAGFLTESAVLWFSGKNDQVALGPSGQGYKKRQTCRNPAS